VPGVISSKGEGQFSTTVNRAAMQLRSRTVTLQK